MLVTSIATAGLMFGPAVAAAQQPLSLGDALRLADRHAYANRAAAAAADLQAAQRDQAFKGILPSLRIDGAWLRTTDPLNAFGFSLRQRSVTQASFGPDALNYPAPISNLGAGVVAEVPLFNPDAWLGRRAAQAATEAALAAGRWTRNTSRLYVVRAYYGGVLAREQTAALEAGLAAAQGHVRLAQSLLTQGLVTRSDLLLAEVKAGEVEAQLLAARGAAELSGRRLAVALGTPDTQLTLPDSLPAPDRLTPLATAEPAATRADVEAARLGRAAAGRDVRRATSLMLPRLNSFGRLDWNDPTMPYAGRPAWTVGVMASWSVFGGGSELAARRGAQARAEQAAAQHDAAEAAAALERAERRTDLDVAMARLAIAERAVRQAAEAHRIVTRKYEGGLAAITELLDASATETRVRVERAAALYAMITGVAAWRLALGHDLLDLAVLDR